MIAKVNMRSTVTRHFFALLPYFLVLPALYGLFRLVGTLEGKPWMKLADHNVISSSSSLRRIQRVHHPSPEYREYRSQGVDVYHSKVPTHVLSAHGPAAHSATPINRDMNMAQAANSRLHLQHSKQETVCRTGLCLDSLSIKDKGLFQSCLTRTSTYIKAQPTTGPKIPPLAMDHCLCHFRTEVSGRTVALVSLPGSGNTWARGLLERATGICTGSLYCDKKIRASGFCGEGVKGASTIAVKTHDTILSWSDDKRPHISGRPLFDMAIFILRSPFDATISDWNRRKGRLLNPNQPGNKHLRSIGRAEYFGQ